MKNDNYNLEKLKKDLDVFAKDRDWDQFHSPKNLSMALSAEVSEIVEHFQWLTEEQSKSLPSKNIQKVEEEIADVLIYLVRLADKLNINLLDAAKKKLKINNEKYPIMKSKGNAKKYSEL